jgi:hypothetical protein
MSKRLGRYGTYPRRPNTDLDRYDDSSKPYVPRINPAVIKENTVRNVKGETEIIGNAPNVKHMKKKKYEI